MKYFDASGLSFNMINIENGTGLYYKCFGNELTMSYVINIKMVIYLVINENSMYIGMKTSNMAGFIGITIVRDYSGKYDSLTDVRINFPNYERISNTNGDIFVIDPPTSLIERFTPIKQLTVQETIEMATRIMSRYKYTIKITEQNLINCFSTVQQFLHDYKLEHNRCSDYDIDEIVILFRILNGEINVFPLSYKTPKPYTLDYEIRDIPFSLKSLKSLFFYNKPSEYFEYKHLEKDPKTLRSERSKKYIDSKKQKRLDERTKQRGINPDEDYYKWRD